MDNVFDFVLSQLKIAFYLLSESVPSPVKVGRREGYVFRYLEKTLEQAIVLKAARLVSGLHASRLLLEGGFLQELGAMQRMIDEIDSDIFFLAGPLTVGCYEARHDQYLKEFFAEEFDNEVSAIKSSQRRHRVPREKIRSYNARTYNVGLAIDEAVSVTETIEKAYSGFVHAAGAHAMDMFGGVPPRFHIDGIRSTSRYQRSKLDLLHYYYRAVGAMSCAAKALGKDDLSIHLWNTSKTVAEVSGLDI